METCDTNLAIRFENLASAHSGRVAIYHGDGVYRSYGELLTRVSKLAGLMHRRFDLKPGDRIALFMNNCPEYIELMLATWWGGQAIVPINAKLHPEELAYILEHSGARHCFTAESLTELSPDPDQESIPAAISGPDELAWLFYTSGTTGRPKGAMLSHRNLLSMIESFQASVLNAGPGRRWLCSAPMSHGAGLYMLPYLVNGGSVVIPESGKFDAGETIRLLRTHCGLATFFAPTLINRVVRHADIGSACLENLHAIVYGGAPMYVQDALEAIRVLSPKLVQIYGQGESPMTISVLSREDHAKKQHPRYLKRLASAGRAQHGVEIRIADNSNEILVRGNTVMQGYWNDSAATATALRDGWLHTGDLGNLDEDGYLTLRGRSTDMIISGGTNIYPREIEEVLLKHPAVHEAAVLGQAHPDWGEQVVAFVVAVPGQQPLSDELDELCLQHIARFKRPRVYHFIHGLPKNNYGKVLKNELRKQLPTHC